jgi:nucleoside-diphosphate-sugar epimerase
MKIFITGSSGYIGNELVKYLSDKHEIVIYDLVNGQDILDYEQLKEKIVGCDVVIHLAAIRGPDESKEFNDYFNINCQGTQNIINCAIENNVARFIYASSTGY